NSFGTAFRGKAIREISSGQLDHWLRSRASGQRTRKNITTAIRTLFGHAKTLGALPHDEPTVADMVKIPKKLKAGEIGIFTPDELRALFAGTKEHPCEDETRLWIALGAFSGVRTQELLRLSWSNVQLAKGQIVIDAKIAKTAGRRVIRIRPNLAEWLAPYAARHGRIFTDRADE